MLQPDGTLKFCNSEYVATMQNYIARQYLAVNGEDKYYGQVPEIVFRKFARRKECEKDMRDDLFDFLFKQSKELFKLRTKKDKQDQHYYIKSNIIEEFGPSEQIDYKQLELDENFDEIEKLKEIRQRLVAKIDFYGTMDELDVYIYKRTKRLVNNLKKRLEHARNKGALNYFNFFTTFTYDDNKHKDPATFVKQIRTALKNFAYRHGWAYMGIKELGTENNREHFHFLLYIPKDELNGELIETKRYCSHAKFKKTQLEHSYFLEHFGINSFERIGYKENDMGPVDYIQKYMSKSEERWIYSHHMPDAVTVELEDIDNDADIDNLETVRLAMHYKCKNGTTKIKAYVISGDYLLRNIPGRHGSKFFMINNPPWEDFEDTA